MHYKRLTYVYSPVAVYCIFILKIKCVYELMLEITYLRFLFLQNIYRLLKFTEINNKI